jgi:hypothetical protein
MTMRAKVILAALFSASAAIAGCAGTPADAPAWYVESADARDGGYPSLHEVGRTTIATTDPAHWAGVEAELLAAGAALKSHPRAEPPGPTAPEAFIEAAREDLERARASHEP